MWPLLLLYEFVLSQRKQNVDIPYRYYLSISTAPAIVTALGGHISPQYRRVLFSWNTWICNSLKQFYASANFSLIPSQQSSRQQGSINDIFYRPERICISLKTEIWKISSIQSPVAFWKQTNKPTKQKPTTMISHSTSHRIWSRHKTNSWSSLRCCPSLAFPRISARPDHIIQGSVLPHGPHILMALFLT